MDLRLPQDFKELLKLFNEHEVEYLVIGGYAVGYYGYPRATNDLDIWINATKKNAERIITALKEFGFNTPDLSPQLFLQDNNIVRMGLPPIRVEIFIDISGLTFNQSYKNRRIDKIENITISFVDKEDLKRNKKASGRFKDLDDLEHLS